MEQPQQAPVKRRRNPARRIDTGFVGADWKAMCATIIEDGIGWREAALKLKLPMTSARYAINRPAVQAYLKRIRLEQLTAICSKNPARLDALADTSDNHTARVKAIQVLEAMQTEASQPTIRQTSPGVVINIVAANKQVTVEPAPAVIEHQDSEQD